MSTDEVNFVGQSRRSPGVITLADYWIRNRGRVQGPLSLERIKGLMRRGRFSRHFHVSQDKKEWLPAEEFPELFSSGRRRKGAAADDDFDDDETPFRSGGSPFEDDDEDERPARKSTKRRAAVVDEDEEEEDDDDEDWEDDEEWEDDEGGMFDSLAGLIEANLKPIAAVLILVLLGLGWFMFTGESFGTDIADMETLVEVNERITMANAIGKGPSEWIALQDSIMAELAPLISRLETTANARDHVKQELLYIARDDMVKRFKELPDGIDDATITIMERLGRIDEMIKGNKRQHPGTIMGGMMQMPSQTAPAQTPPAGAANSQQPGEQGDAAGGQSQQMPNQGQPNTGQPNTGQPNTGQPNGGSFNNSNPGAGGNFQQAPGNNRANPGGGMSSSGGMNPAGGTNRNGMNSGPNTSNGPPQNPGSGIPGRPGKSKF